MYYLLAFAAAAAASLVVHFHWSRPYSKQVETFTKGDGKSVRVGIISDSQLPYDGKPSKWTERVGKALAAVRKNNADVLIYAGDFTDAGTRRAWRSFREKYDKIYGDRQAVPVFVMGNHDHWLPAFTKCFEFCTPAKMQKRFMKYTGEHPFSHKVVNGYHFISWSSENGTYDKSYTNTKWVRGEIEKAISQSPDKPVFVVTHLNPSNSVYGSDEWGNDDIYSVFRDYPQVISFSGHSHYSLLDERSIYQGEFTAINTQSIDYIELETGKFNGSVPRNAYGESIADEVPAVMMVYADEKGVKIDRLHGETGEKIKESWVMDVPLDRSAFRYTEEKRRSENKGPWFEKDAGGEIRKAVSSKGEPITTVVFTAAKDDDFVHSYAVEYCDAEGNKLKFEKTDYDGNILKKGKETQYDNRSLYFSSFMLGLGNMPEKEELRLTGRIPQETAFLKIYAIDSWGEESEPLKVPVKSETVS